MRSRGVTNHQLAKMIGAPTDAQVSRMRSGLPPGKYLPKLIKKLDLTEVELAELGWDTKETAGA